MYAVVGCDECSALWIVEGNPETSQCPRCGRTRGYEKRREFVTTPDKDHAREVRASMLAARQGHGDAFAELDSFAELDDQIDDAGVDMATYLEQSGIDPEQLKETTDTETTTSSRTDIVRNAVRTLEDPSMENVVEYASEHDVQPEYTEQVLQKLVRSGEATETGGIYRLV